MAAFDYVQAQIDADSLITDFGMAGAIVRQTDHSGGDAWNPVAGEPEVYPCTLVVVEYATLQDMNLQQSDGSRVEKGNKQVLVSPLNLTIDEIKPSDRVRIGTSDFEIVHVSVTKPATLVVLWDLQVRGL